MALKTDYENPTYSLADIQKLAKDPKTRHITVEARKNAAELGYLEDEEMVAEILLLSMANFFKTMPAERCPGLFHDVYKTAGTNGAPLYIKLQISPIGDGVIISFKKDES